MSWLGEALMLMAYEILGEWEVHEDVRAGLGKLANLMFLCRYVRPGAEKLTPVELGKRLDDGLVEFIHLNIPDPKLRGAGVEEFQSVMREIENGRRESPALKAFEAARLRDEGLPLASGIYFNLANGYIQHRFGQGTRKKRRRPFTVEGRRFVRIRLRGVMKESFAENDWEIESFTRQRADRWLRNPSTVELLKLVVDSKRSAAAWDTLKWIIEKLADAGEALPHLLLHWDSERAKGLLPRPDAGPKTRYGRGTLGIKVRNNEIRHTAILLNEVGFFKSAVHMAVAQEFGFTWSSIRDICGKIHLTYDQLGEDAMKRIEPNFYAHLYKPGSESSPSR